MSEVLAFPIGFRPTTLEDLWAEAETLGKISTDMTYGGNYTASIMFRTSGGSLVFAKGEHRSISCAVGLAINAARELGAGTPG
jgi:proline racemase